MLSIVIPIFNEEATISTLHQRIVAAAPAWELPFEVILVDDGSTDRPLLLLRELHQADVRFKYTSFSRNFGHQTAVSTGLHYATGDL